MSARSESPVLSSDVLSTQLNQRLPLHVSSQDVEEQPQLALLLEDLSLRLSHTAILTATHTRLTDAAAALKQARRGYMEQSVLQHYLLSAARTAQAPKVLRQVEDAFSLSQLAVSLQLTHLSNNSDNASANNSTTTSLSFNRRDNSSSTHNISNSIINSTSDGSAADNSSGSSHEASVDVENAGKNQIALDVALRIKPENMRDPLRHHFASPRLLAERAARLCGGARTSALLTQHLGNRIVEAWHGILPCITPAITEHCDGQTAVLHIARLSEKIGSSGQLLTRHSALTHSLILQVDGQLVSYGESISQLVRQRRLSHQPLHHLLYLSTTLHAQYHKLRCVELQLLCSTYSTEALTALSSLTRQLEQRIRDTSSQLSVLQHRLEPYSHLDPTYLALLDEHNKLKADIDFCKAAQTS